MDAPGYTPRDQPQTEAETIAMLRAHLRCVTDALEGVLEHGFPARGRSQDAKEASEQWWEDRWNYVRRAQEALELSNGDL